MSTMVGWSTPLGLPENVMDARTNIQEEEEEEEAQGDHSMSS